MGESRATILIIEDEPEIRRFLRSTLSAVGHKIIEAASAGRGAIDAASHKPDLAIIDLGLPDFDGIELIKKIRTWSSMPILVLSARVQERAKIDALDAGADDYITKPFGVGELLARMRVALRHHTRASSGEIILKLGESTINLKTRKAMHSEQELHLTPIEYRLINCLSKSLGMVVTQRHLLNEVWGPTHVKDTHYLRIYMKQLRDKFESDPLQPRHFITETGVGYRLVVED